ncbi:MAG: hypothetical protein OHK0053_17990 [Microscillaceae bacterium]
MHQPPKQAGTDSVKTEPETNNIPTTSLDTNTENRPEQVSKENSPPPSSKDKREMMAFAENRNLENMQKNLLRGQPTGIRNPKPDTNAVVDKEIVFSWEGQAQEENILLEVLNNQELVVAEQAIQAQQSQRILNVENWPEGLYYWRLMGKRELYFLGKFKIIHQ